MKLENLLMLIAKEEDKKELLELVDQYQNASRRPGLSESTSSSAVDLRRQEAMTRIMERIHWHFRAMRHPLPTQQEIEEMVAERRSKGN